MKKIHEIDTVPGRLRAEAAKKYPGIWDAIRDARKKLIEFGETWEPWCDTPDGAAVLALFKYYGTEAVARLRKQIETQKQASDELVYYNLLHPSLTALHTWDKTKGIYKFDPSLSKELAEMDFEGNIPSDVLMRLPEWCIYVDLSDCPIHRITGFFSFLEQDIERKTKELYILTVPEQGFLCVPYRVFIGDFDLKESVTRCIMDDLRVSREEAEETYKKQGRLIQGVTTPLLNHVIYLCSQEPDLANHNPYSTRKGPTRARMVSTDVTQWDVGVRIGAVLRSYKGRESNGDNTGEMRDGSGGRARPRPHVRRAHWHHYWTGPRTSERELTVKWLHPAYVNAVEDTSSMPVVVKAVKK